MNSLLQTGKHSHERFPPFEHLSILLFKVLIGEEESQLEKIAGALRIGMGKKGGHELMRDLPFFPSKNLPSVW